MSPSALETSLGYQFVKPALLEQALTHRSHGARHNERLEFLGDSVLSVSVSALLFNHYGTLDEGDLSRVRANLVKQASLAEIAQKLELSKYLRLGEGELKSGGFRRPSILAAVFLDGGYVAAQQLIERLYVPILASVDPLTLGKDAKTLLQEFLQSRQYALPVYNVVATHGAAHSQQFEVECSVPVLDIKVVAAGASRRAAEQSAAKLALVAAEAASPAPAKKRSTRARKTAQLTLPVAVAQELK